MSDIACIAIETSTRKGSVAACINGRTEQRMLDEDQTSSRQIYQIINELLHALDARMANFDCIAFGCGPGGFTGLRVATSVAQALAYSVGLPVCRVSTLAGLAAPALADAELAAVCLDARMGEAYVGIYSKSQSGELIVEMEDCLVNPAEFRLSERAPDAVAVGPGWQEWEVMLEGFHGSVMSECHPEAAEILQLAKVMYAQGKTVQAAEALPNYVRNTVTQ